MLGGERLMLARGLGTAAVVVLLFGCLFPNLVPSTLNPDWSLTIYNASSTPYTLRIMTWAGLIFAPLVIAYQAWTYWVFRKRISVKHIPEQPPVTFTLENANPSR